MAAIQLMRPLTYDDLRQMPDDLNCYEIINGELLLSPSPNRAHQRLAAILFKLVSRHVDANGLGEVLFAPVDVQLSMHDVVEPDLLFLRADRRDMYKESGLVAGPPDLVIEIISPSSASIDTIRKAALYARAGVQEYWLPDPEKKSFRMLALGGGVYQDVRPIDGRFHSTVLAGLVINPSEIFANLA